MAELTASFETIDAITESWERVKQKPEWKETFGELVFSK